jgi:hypothetical protein
MIEEMSDIDGYKPLNPNDSLYLSYLKKRQIFTCDKN